MSDDFAFQKTRRIHNPDLIKKVRDQRCTICNSWPSDAHHITTRGAGGDDTGDNLMPLCRDHHILWHQKGIGFMIQQFNKVSDWLICHERLEVLFDRQSRTDGTDQCIDQQKFKYLKSRR